LLEVEEVMGLTKSEEEEVGRLQAAINDAFVPMANAWTDGTPKNILDQRLAQAEEATRSAKARIAKIRRDAAKRDK
jgi:hypothetical protein